MTDLVVGLVIPTTEPMDAANIAFFHAAIASAAVQHLNANPTQFLLRRTEGGLARSSGETFTILGHYTSTYCVHGDHAACRRTCKHRLHEQCRCHCHGTEPQL